MNEIHNYDHYEALYFRFGIDGDCSRDGSKWTDRHEQQSAGYNDQYAAGVSQVDGRLLGRPFQRDVNHGHLVDVGHLEHALGDH